MKKKMSLIDLNNNEIKKNGMKQLLTEELGNAKGGAKCYQPMCFMICYPIWDQIEDNEQLAQEQYLENLYGPF